MSPDAQTRAAMVEAAIRGVDWPNTPEYRMRILRGITAAILAAEARGFKMVGAKSTREMQMHASIDGDFGDTWSAMHAAAPGWGDGT